MLALTAITYLVGESGVVGLGSSLGVLVLALIKGQMLGDYFMGLRAVRGFWRWPVAIWLIVPAGLITSAFTLAT